MKHLLLCVMIFLLLTPALRGKTTKELEIKEWPVPWEDTRPRDPFVDAKGRVWFCGQAGNYVAFLEPSTSKFKRYELPKGTFPHNLIVDKTGMVWYAGNQNAHIGKLNPDNGEITKFPMPNPDAGDPHTLVFTKTEDIWFTVQWGNFIGKLGTKTGKVSLAKIATPKARPYGIKMDASDRPWVALFGTNKLATIDPQTLLIKEIVLPRKEARPRRLEITSDGSIWYVDYNEGYLGRYDPKKKLLKEWALPGGKKAMPYGTARDNQDRIWIAETGEDPNRLVGFDPKTENFFGITNVPSGGETIRHMYFHPSTKEIWFGTDLNTLGRARLIQ